MVFTPPTFATLHGRTDPRSRPSMVAIVQLVSSLLGGGLGPFLGGLSIDLLSDTYYAGDFAAACIGKAPMSGGPDEAYRLCAGALLQGTTTSLLLTAPLLLWPAAHFWLAARAIGANRARED